MGGRWVRCFHDHSVIIMTIRSSGQSGGSVYESTEVSVGSSCNRHPLHLAGGPFLRPDWPAQEARHRTHACGGAIVRIDSGSKPANCSYVTVAFAYGSRGLRLAARILALADDGGRAFRPSGFHWIHQRRREPGRLFRTGDHRLPVLPHTLQSHRRPARFVLVFRERRSHCDSANRGTRCPCRARRKRGLPRWIRVD
jgi:hypothetical protein